jgi:hypothetical protein
LSTSGEDGDNNNGGGDGNGGRNRNGDGGGGNKDDARNTLTYRTTTGPLAPGIGRNIELLLFAAAAGEVCREVEIVTPHNVFVVPVIGVIESGDATNNGSSIEDDVAAIADPAAEERRRRRRKQKKLLRRELGGEVPARGHTGVLTATLTEAQRGQVRIVGDGDFGASRI